MQVFCEACSAQVTVEGRGPVTCERCGNAFVPDVAFLDWLEVPFNRRCYVLDRPRLVIGRTTIGRTGPVDIRIPHRNTSREQSVIIEGDTGWFIDDLGSSAGTYSKNGLVRRETQMTSGDQFRVPTELVNFWSAAMPRVRTLPPALRSAPQDPAGWRVWADQLLERADALGLWLTATSRVRLDLHALAGALLMPEHLTTGEWNDFGFLMSLSIPGDILVQRRDFCDPRVAPATQALISLEVTGSFVEASLEAIAAAPLPPSLRALSVEGAGASAVDMLRRQLGSRCPLLVSPPSSASHR